MPYNFNPATSCLANFNAIEADQDAVDERLDALEAGSAPTPTPTPTPTPDTTPSMFGFTDQTGAARNTLVESNAITVGGIDAPAPISVAGGAYQIGSGAWTSSAGTVTNGQSVKVRLTTSVSYSTIANCTLNIGGVSDTFSVTTEAAPAPAPTPTPGPTPTGFAMNGSTNPALKAMLSRGYGKIVIKGDSTSAGAGAAIVANGTSSSITDQLTNARPYRPSAVIASLATAAGYPTVDNAFVGDASNGLFGVKLEQYDPRIDDGDWTGDGGATFAGGAYLFPSANLLKFTPTGTVGVFEIVLYSVGGTFAFNVDGGSAAIASTTVNGSPLAGTALTLPNTGNGFVRIVITLNTVATHELQMGGENVLLRSVEGYASATSAIRILNHASSGAKSGDQSASGNGWLNNDALGYDAPDFTIVQVGLNDAANAVSTSTYTTNLQSIVTKAKLSGDVLVLWANAANPATFASQATQEAFRNAAAAVAASSGVAFGDHLAAFGNWATVGNRTADQTVHPNRGFYADIAAYDWSCIQAMSAA